MARCEKQLVALDRHWRTDHQWITSMVGEAGEKRLQAKCLECLPRADRPATLTTAVQGLHLIVDSALFRFCSDSARGMVENVQNTLNLMMSGRPPAINQNATVFMKKVFARCSLFARHGSPPNELVGKLAVEAHLEDLSGKGAQNCSVANIEPIVVFHWLLGKENQAKAIAFRNDVLSNARAVSHIGSGLPASSSTCALPDDNRNDGKTKGTLGRPRKGPTEVQRALDMFG